MILRTVKPLFPNGSSDQNITLVEGENIISEELTCIWTNFSILDETWLETTISVAFMVNFELENVSKCRLIFFGWDWHELLAKNE